MTWFEENDAVRNISRSFLSIEIILFPCRSFPPNLPNKHSHLHDKFLFSLAWLSLIVRNECTCMLYIYIIHP